MDNLFLTGPAGTTLNIGSWLEAAQQIDFGENGLLQAIYAQNPILEGGVLGFEHAGVRQFSIPLILASSNSFGGLSGLQGMIRKLARPGGAYIDLQFDSVATADAVRFDVLTGRLVPNYQVFPFRVGRMFAELQLDVRPFGYLPTTVTLASAASVGIPGLLAIPQASILGDVPGLAQITVHPWGGSANSGTSYAAGSWGFDFFGWSMGARASFQAFWPAASILTQNTVGGASFFGESFAPGSQAQQSAFTPGSYAGSWFNGWHVDISGALEPAYRGRFRLFSWVKQAGASANPSGGMCVQWSGDAVTGGLGANAALASAQPIATSAPGVASGFSYGAQPSPAYQLIDLGEISLPGVGSGLSQGGMQSIRLWANCPSVATTVATGYPIRVGGIYLMPLDGADGLQIRGLQYPSISDANVTAVSWRADIDRRRYSFSPRTATNSLADDADRYYRGELPLIAGSTIEFDIFGAERHVGSTAAVPGATAPLIRAAETWVKVSVEYRPRFLFLKGI